MFFSLSQQDIINSKLSIFPAPDDFNIKSLVVAGDNDRNSFKMSLLVRDVYKKPKIFSNLEAKKFMRMKMFEISSSDIKQQLEKTKNFSEILKIINDNNLFYKDLNVGYDFNGSKTDIADHIIQGEYVILEYFTNFEIFKKINYLSLGMIFYYDFSEYFNEKEILEKDANKDLLYGDLKIFDIYDNGSISNLVGVQDIRILNSIFNENASLAKIAEQTAISSKTLKILSENKPKIVKTGQYFSNIYISRKIDYNLGLLFNINQYKLLKENTAYGKYLQNTILEDQIMSKATVKSIKILRREIDWYTGAPKNYTVKTLINSSQKNRYIAMQDNGDAYINEIDLSSDEGNRVFTIEVLDKNVFKNKIGVFEYGVQMTIADGFTDYVNRLIDNLLNDQKKLNYYLSETDKIVYPKNKFLDNKPEQQKTVEGLNGYYDAKNNRFTDYFKAFVYPQKHQSNILSATTNLISAIKLFNALTNENDFIKCLVNILNPSTATVYSINAFLNLHKKFINQLQTLVNDKNNSLLEFEHWFKNEYVDVEISNDYGYEFLDVSKEGFGSLSGAQLKTRVNQEIQKISTDNALPPSQQSNANCYLSPKGIYTKNYKLELNNLVRDASYYSPFNYSEIELDIKRENLIASSDKQVSLNYAANASQIEKQSFKLKFSNLFDKLSLKTNNLLIEDDSTRTLFKKGTSTNTYLENSNVDPTLLFISLAKNINLEKQTFKNNQIKEISYIEDSTERIELNNNYPYHLDLLLQNKCKIFSKTDKVLSNLSLNSKFLLLFNTIHSIEILNFSNENVKSENWRLLTKDVIDNLNPSDTFLCRLKLYQNKIFSLENFNDITMPVYNQYFLLKNLQDLQGIQYATIPQPTAEKVFTINTEKLNIAPIVSRFTTNIQQIPTFVPRPVTNEQNSANSSTPAPLYVEDQPVVDTEKIFVVNPYPLAFPDGEAPEKIVGPDLYYKNATGLPDNSFKEQAVIVTNDPDSTIEGQWVKISNYGSDQDGKLFADGIIYKMAYDYEQLKIKHGDEVKLREEFDGKIKSETEVDKNDTINEFGQRVLAYGKHFAIGNNQRLQNVNGTFKMVSSNRKYELVIDQNNTTITIKNVETGQNLWFVNHEALQSQRARSNALNYIPVVNIGSGIFTSVTNNAFKDYGVSSIYFNDSQLQFYSAKDTGKIYMQWGKRITDKKETAYMILQDDGNLVIYNNNSVTWSSSTNGDKISNGPKNIHPNGKSDEVFLEGISGGDKAKLPGQ